MSLIEFKGYVFHTEDVVAVGPLQWVRNSSDSRRWLTDECCGFTICLKHSIHITYELSCSEVAGNANAKTSWTEEEKDEIRARVSNEVGKAKEALVRKVWGPDVTPVPIPNGW